jgi:hypothetical protein
VGGGAGAHRGAAGERAEKRAEEAEAARAEGMGVFDEDLGRPLSTEGGTRRVRLVRKEGRDVSAWYGRRIETCPVNTGGEGGGG